MTDKILRLKIKEALAAAGNNRHDAHKLLLTWAVRDPSLLLSMTKPHLKAIAAGLVDHYVRQGGAETDDISGEDAATSSDKISRSTIDDIVSAGKRIPTDKRRNVPVPPPKSTERQASTMRKLAAAFTKKKK